jgi:hypothetical protein
MRDPGEQKIDRVGRERPVQKEQKVPVLVAQGVWPASGH